MKSVLGIDIGYGDIKVIFGTSDGTITSQFKFPAVIGITKCNAYIQDPRIFNFDGRSYYVGQDALNLPSENLIDITEYKNLEFYAPLFLYSVIKRIGTTPDIVVCGLSKSQIENSGYFKERLKAFTVNGMDFKFENVFILPQGAGSKLAIDKYGDDFPNQQQDFNLTKNFVGVDIGFNTLDMFLVSSGKTSPNLFEGIEHEGIMKIATEVARIIKAKFDRDITLHEAKEILDTSVYRLRGEKHDLSEDIKKIKETYLKELLELIYSKYGNIMDKCDYVYLTGGGSAFFDTQRSKFVRTPKSNYEYYNAIGFYLFGGRQA